MSIPAAAGCLTPALRWEGGPGCVSVSGRLLIGGYICALGVAINMGMDPTTAVNMKWH
jgi:hypothetical protein